MYEFLLTVHVLAAVIWVGGAVTMHIFGRLATKEGPERELAFTQQSIRIGNMVYAPLSVLLLIGGIFLVDEVGYSYGDPWITLGFLGFLTSFAVGVGYYPRAARTYAELAVVEGPGSDAARAIYRRTATVNMVELSILLLVVVAMTTKPG
ncbi:MAG: hypothetical protein QOH58_1524 [Thermoleophilaceae bacterium]|jgi:uncharacterized membrane protein|nr:hypothetical protein [Thermoleophilaceae bacterium]